MNKPYSGMTGFGRGKARRATLACVLGLVLAALWPGASAPVHAEGEGSLYNIPVIDSATDDGGGKIRIAWSWGPIPETQQARTDSPEDICVYWDVDESSTLDNKTCFTSELPTQADLVFDTNIDESTPSAVYRVLLRINYAHTGFFSPPSTKVTVKRP